jgi:predicted DNA-binding transcriptional regulator AlpA
VELLTLSEVAALLRIKRHSAIRHLEQTDPTFPRGVPILHRNGRRKWRRDAVEAWFRQKEAAAQAAEEKR